MSASPFKAGVPIMTAFFFISSCDLASALSVCLSGSCTKKAKAIWQPPPDKREVVEQEKGMGEVEEG